MISKAAYDKKALVKDLTFTRSARSGWELILNSVKRVHGRASVLLPSYIGFTEREGSGIFDPVESTSSDFGFYDINDDLSINYDSLDSLVGSGKFNVLLIVHYFGFCRNDLRRLKELCQANDIIMVEDCAHAFQLWSEQENLGVTGDFSFYSVHKYLPVEDGGILKNISKKIELLNLPEEDGVSLDTAVQLLKSDYKAIMEKRKHNFGLYAEKLSGVEGIQIMYDLEDNEIPQTFPIRVKNDLREKLYFYLLEKDMPTIALYYRLIDNLDKATHTLSHQISHEILNLPLHQDTTDEDIDRLTSEIKSFLAGRQ